MTDIIDQANDVAQQSIERAIANAPKFNGPSLAECQDCGDHIPLQRQQLGSVTRCIDCQQYFDKKQRGYRRWEATVFGLAMFNTKNTSHANVQFAIFTAQHIFVSITKI